MSISTALRDRYFTDPLFHTIANTLCKLLVEKRLNPNELDEVILVAKEKYYMEWAEKAEREHKPIETVKV